MASLMSSFNHMIHQSAKKCSWNRFKSANDPWAIPMPRQAKFSSSLHSCRWLLKRRSITICRGSTCLRISTEERRKLRRSGGSACAWPRCTKQLETLRRWFTLRSDRGIGSCKWRARAGRNFIRAFSCWQIGLQSTQKNAPLLLIMRLGPIRNFSPNLLANSSTNFSSASEIS